MRNIKFRGKRIDNGEWVYGTYHYSNDGKYHYICAREKFFGISPHKMLHDKEVWQVDPKTVGQLTGLHDKDNKSIYEGDKFYGVSANEFSRGSIHEYEVVWGVDGWLIKGTYMSLTEIINFCNNNIKVFGTIHD